VGVAPKPIIAAIYVLPAYRRCGLATRLYEAARKELGPLLHSPHLSSAGEAWVASLEPLTTSSAV